MKTCTKCKIEKETIHFSKRKDRKYQSKCKDCNKKYRKENSLKIKLYYVNNKVSLLQYKESYRKNRRLCDPAYKLRQNISRIIGHILKKNNSSKCGESILEYLPYTFNQLKLHIENQFELWMNWNNQGIYELNSWNDTDSTTWKWQLDHIIPQSSLPYTSMKDDNFQKCWALNNLRPLSAKQNLIDSDRRDL